MLANHSCCCSMTSIHRHWRSLKYLTCTNSHFKQLHKIFCLCFSNSAASACNCILNNRSFSSHCITVAPSRLLGRWQNIFTPTRHVSHRIKRTRLLLFTVHVANSARLFSKVLQLDALLHIYSNLNIVAGTLIIMITQYTVVSHLQGIHLLSKTVYVYRRHQSTFTMEVNIQYYGT